MIVAGVVVENVRAGGDGGRSSNLAGKGGALGRAYTVFRFLSLFMGIVPAIILEAIDLISILAAI